MQNTSLLNSHNNQALSVNQPSKEPHSKSTQHVSQIGSLSSKLTGDGFDKRRSFLVDLPDESLGHIITYVDTPSSLLALSKVNRRLRNCVTDDSTWYRSFAYHYWGIGPENYPFPSQRIMLRHSENTWKKEFIKRHELLLRWENSRSAMMSYQPHSWSISSMHLLDNMSLMTASLQYGIVARSFPLTGKILRGFMDASGTANGFGIGNPNVEFSPHVSCIAISSRGGTAYITWGFRNGEIALTTASRVMDSYRPAARYLRCHAQDEHPSQVQSLIFTSAGSAGDDDDLILSSCVRGQVKVWDSRRLRCLWSGTTNEKGVDNNPPDPAVKLAYSANASILVAVCQSGDLVIWSQFKVCRDNNGGYLVEVAENTRIARPGLDGPKVVDSLFIDPESDLSRAILLVHYAEDKYFSSYVINHSLGNAIVRSHFEVDVEESFPMTSLKPYFALNKVFSVPSNSIFVPTTFSTLSAHSRTHRMARRSFPFILTGDSIGNVSVWDWDVHSNIPQPQFASNGDNNNNKVIQSDTVTQPCRTWEAHEDGAVSSLEVNDYIIITGSSKGTIKVWDILTLNQLRVFPPPVTRPACNGPVGQIFVRDDLLIANIGARVLVWQPKPVPSNKKIKVKRPGQPKGRSTSTAMNRWQQQMELLSDIKQTKQDLEAERAQVNRVNGRIKAEQISLDGLGLTEAEAVDYLLMLSREEEERKRITSDVILSSPPTSAANVSSVDALFVLDGIDDESLTSPNAAVTTTHLDQRLDQVPWTAPSDDTSSNSRSPASSQGDFNEFPNVASTSNVRLNPRTPSTPLTGSWSRGSPARSWQSPNNTAASSLSATSSCGSPSSNLSPTQFDARRRTREEEDEELRFVLELSLAEARSRGEI